MKQICLARMPRTTPLLFSICLTLPAGSYPISMILPSQSQVTLASSFRFSRFCQYRIREFKRAPPSKKYDKPHLLQGLGLHDLFHYNDGCSVCCYGQKDGILRFDNCMARSDVIYEFRKMQPLSIARKLLRRRTAQRIQTNARRK